MLRKPIARVLLFAVATAVTTTAIPLMYRASERSIAGAEALPSSEEFRCRRKAEAVS